MYPCAVLSGWLAYRVCRILLTVWSFHGENQYSGAIFPVVLMYRNNNNNNNNNIIIIMMMMMMMMMIMIIITMIMMTMIMMTMTMMIVVRIISATPKNKYHKKPSVSLGCFLPDLFQVAPHLLLYGTFTGANILATRVDYCTTTWLLVPSA